MKPTIRVTDHAVSHGLDVEAVKHHLADLTANGVRLGAIGVTIENVKLVIARGTDEARIVTALKPQWPALAPRDPGAEDT